MAHAPGERGKALCPSPEVDGLGGDENLQAGQGADHAAAFRA
jgi:hypothetical protein